MRSAAVVACLALACGCASTSTSVSVNAGTTMSSAQGGLHVRASGGAALAIVVIALIGAGVQDLREGRPLPSPRALIPGNTEPVPPLAPGRPVNEQDCSKPIADWSANLKCK